MTKLLQAISVTDLIAYFKFLDDRRMPSAAGAMLALSNRYPGMTRDEARTVAKAWRETVNPTLPAEDRALNALENA